MKRIEPSFSRHDVKDFLEGYLVGPEHWNEEAVESFAMGIWFCEANKFEDYSVFDAMTYIDEIRQLVLSVLKEMEAGE